jgi:hypothetical protein
VERILVEKLRSSYSREFDLFLRPREVASVQLEHHLYPPLPVTDEHLIWGFALLKQAEEAGVDSLMCRKLEVGPLEGLVIALTLENRCGQYSWREKSNIYTFLEHHGYLADSDKVAPLVEKGGSFAEQVQKFHTLSDTAAELVDRGMLDLKTGLRVKTLPESVFSLFLHSSCDLSFSTRRLVMAWLFEIAVRDQLAAAKVEELAREILDSDKPKQCCQHHRFPGLSAMYEEFEAFRKQHLSGSGIEITPPPSFEGERFTVTFSFNSTRNLEEKINTLKKIRDHSDEMFRLLY